MNCCVKSGLINKKIYNSPKDSQVHLKCSQGHSLVYDQNRKGQQTYFECISCKNINAYNVTLNAVKHAAFNSLLTLAKLRHQRHVVQNTNQFSKDINRLCSFVDPVKSIFKEIISLVDKSVDFPFALNARKHDFGNIYYQIMAKRLIVFIVLILITHQTTNSLEIHFHLHQWCPPCRKILTLSKRLQKAFPEISYLIHNYTDRTLIFANNSLRSLPYPTIQFKCNQHNFRYQNDLTFTQMGYWISVVCLRKIPECTDKINEQLYHILMENVTDISEQLLTEILRYPHIKICSTPQSNITSDRAIQLLKITDKKTLYFDYFSNNIRNYLINSKKLAVAILTNEKNTSRINSFLQTYINLNNFVSDQKLNQTDTFYRYDLPQQYKQNLVFLELCQNVNISKCYYRPQRKNQVQNNQKMIDKLLHFLDMSTEGGFERVIAFRFQEPTLDKHNYHNFGNLDEKFLFWINEVASKQNKKLIKGHCYWNSLTHRISQNSLEDIEAYRILSHFFDSRNKHKAVKPFPLNKIIKNYNSQSKLTLCFQGKSPINYESNKQVENVINQIKSFDQLSLADQL